MNAEQGAVQQNGEQRSAQAAAIHAVNGLPRYAFDEQLVIANDVKQSMRSETMDCRASLAVTTGIVTINGSLNSTSEMR